MKKTFRALAALLDYPDADLVAALPEIRGVVPKAVLPLIDELARQDLMASQERYVALFDRSRALSLHLFEHVHGDSRERGQAMVDLQALYEAHGLLVAAQELPDYLPAFLEFLSVVSRDEAEGLLKEIAPIIRPLGERLAERGSPYALVFSTLLNLSGEKGLSKPIRSFEERGVENLLALDRQWADPEVTFGGPQPVRFHKKVAA